MQPTTLPVTRPTTQVAVLASGSGTTLQAILDAFNAARAPESVERGEAPSREPATPERASPVKTVLVVSNNPDAFALERARAAGVAAAVVDHRRRSRDVFEADLARVLELHRIDLVCLAGFLRILSPWFVSRFPGRIINTHPALLPAFGGKGMYGEHVHRAVLDAKAAVSGCTIHVVDEVADGGPIIAQATVPVLPGDTPETLAARVQAQERRLYPEVIRWWAEGRIGLARRHVILHPPVDGLRPAAHAIAPEPIRA